MRRRLLRISLALLLLLTLAGGVWGAVWWIRYPKVPDPAKTDVSAAIDFMGTDDFNRMTESHRKRYCLAVADRMRQKAFPEMVETFLRFDENRRKAAENVNRMKEKDKQEVGGAFLRVFLDKFYELPKQDRENYLMMWALAEKLGGRPGDLSAKPGDGKPPAATTRPIFGGGRPRDRSRVPSPAEVEKKMAEFFSNQPPRTVAQMTELMNSMRKKREALGIKDP